LRIPELPRDVQVASQLRHNIILAVKETVNNIIKHASASEVAFQVTFEGDLLTISISDNGSGFDTANQLTGNGLANMKQRLEAIGGRCKIESSTGKGTTILMHVAARAANSRREMHSLGESRQ
jgi:signal transduction histidine kinase